jgi:hemolysin activation/secretion protein
VSFDNEKLQEGHLKIEVTASSINEIIIEGEAKNNHLIKKYASKILESTPTKISVTQKYIALMSKVPGYEIMYDLVTQEETSDKEPLVDLLIESTHKNASVFTGTDNFGDESLGKYQGLLAGEYFTPILRSSFHKFRKT